MIIKIDDVQISNFTNLEINLNYDTVADTFALSIPFYKDYEQHKNRFKPLRYHFVKIYDNNNKELLTGCLLNYTFKSNASANEIAVSGYSTTGVIGDCPDVPKDGESSNYSGLTLKELAIKMLTPFGIDVEVDDIVKDKMNEPYDSVTTKSTDSIATILGKMATFKNIVMRTTAGGNILFTQVNPNTKPKIKFSTGDGVVNDISLTINGQSMHSEMTILGAVTIDENAEKDKESTGAKNIIENPLVIAYRPTIKEQGTETGAIKDAAKAYLADELKNISLSINCKGWNVIDDGILRAGDLVSVKAPDIYLYNWNSWLVRSIKLNEDSNGKTSTLSCVLPETITGEQPKFIFD